MSPIRSWDAYYSRWIQPRFWTGSGWRYQNDYVPYDPGIPATPPTYSPVGVWGFDGDLGGWFNSTFNNSASEPYINGGTMLRQDQLEAGLFSSARASSPTNQVRLPVGTAYRIHAAINISRRSGSEPSTKDLILTCVDASAFTTLPEGNTGWAEYTSPFAYTQYEYTSFYVQAGVDSGALNSNSLYTWDMDWCRIEGGDGNPLMWESDPGDPGVPPTPEQEAWPLWWDGGSWRR